MTSTEEHYEKLLGLKSPWAISRVDLKMDELRVDIFIEYLGEEASCSKCGNVYRVYDKTPQRTWRHLDTMQFETILHCQSPRVMCAQHGVKVAELPWAQKHSRFTLLFEAFAIDVMRASRSLQEAGKLLNLNWHQMHRIMKRAVERGLVRRDREEIAWIGMDEKSFRKGHNYVSIMNDIEKGRVLDVVEGRDGKVAKKLINKGLDDHQREMVCGVAIDMSAPYVSAIKKLLPHADIVHDKFHISKHLNEAVDLVRRQDHRKLLKQKDTRLTGTKFLWLKGMEHLSDESLAELEYLKMTELNVAQAWSLKELFRHFWTRRDRTFANSYFEFWYREAIKSGLKAIQSVARMLKKHLPNILTYFECYITNAVSEGINSKIQTIKANARGFRNFENYRTSILFFCGKLDLAPQKST
jgi:transposase